MFSIEIFGVKFHEGLHLSAFQSGTAEVGMNICAIHKIFVWNNAEECSATSWSLNHIHVSIMEEVVTTLSGPLQNAIHACTTIPATVREYKAVPHILHQCIIQ